MQVIATLAHDCCACTRQYGGSKKGDEEGECSDPEDKAEALNTSWAV